MWTIAVSGKKKLWVKKYPDKCGRGLRRIRKYLSKDNTKTLVHAFISSKIDYCNSLLYGLPEYELNKLQRVQNMCARLICNESNESYGTLLSYPTVKPKTTLGERAPVFAAPKLWNALPRYIRESISVDTFKSRLKTHLLKKVFCTI